MNRWLGGMILWRILLFFILSSDLATPLQAATLPAATLEYFRLANNPRGQGEEGQFHYYFSGVSRLSRLRLLAFDPKGPRLLLEKSGIPPRGQFRCLLPAEESLQLGLSALDENGRELLPGNPPLLTAILLRSNSPLPVTGMRLVQVEPAAGEKYFLHLFARSEKGLKNIHWFKNGERFDFPGLNLRDWDRVIPLFPPNTGEIVSLESTCEDLLDRRCLYPATLENGTPIIKQPSLRLFALNLSEEHLVLTFTPVPGTPGDHRGLEFFIRRGPFGGLMPWSEATRGQREGLTYYECGFARAQLAALFLGVRPRVDTGLETRPGQEKNGEEIRWFALDSFSRPLEETPRVPGTGVGESFPRMSLNSDRVDLSLGETLTLSAVVRDRQGLTEVFLFERRSQGLSLEKIQEVKISDPYLASVTFTRLMDRPGVFTFGVFARNCRGLAVTDKNGPGTAEITIRVK